MKIAMMGILFTIFTALTLAIIDFRDGGEYVRVYAANQKTYDGAAYFIPNGITEYRVTRKNVTSNVGGFVSSYNDCVIFDTTNWQCRYLDNSATFGMRSGNFYSIPNLSLYPHLANYDKEVYLSRIGYMWLKCSRDWQSSGINSTISCAVRPFFE